MKRLDQFIAYCVCATVAAFSICLKQAPVFKLVNFFGIFPPGFTVEMAAHFIYYMYIHVQSIRYFEQFRNVLRALKIVLQ